MSTLDPSHLNTVEKAAFSAIDSLITGKAFFSKRDFRKALQTLTPKYLLDRSDFEAILTAVLERIKLVPLFPSQPESDFSLFTTARTIRLEREMIEMAKATSDAHELPGLPGAIAKLTQSVIDQYPTMADEQKAVVLASCSTKNNVVITEGTAGAGKSFSLNAIRQVYEQVPARHAKETVGYDIIGTALSWNAAKVLEESANLPTGSAVALAGLLDRMKVAHSTGQEFFKKRSILVVDEAGLAPTEVIRDILFYAKESKHDVRVILTGDSLQLNPVQAGNSLELLVEECGSTRLDTIRRQKQASHRAAVKHFCYGRAEHGLYTYHQQEAVRFSANRDALFEQVVKDYIAYTTAFPDKTALILALKNDDVHDLNQRVRQSLKASGRIEPKGVTLPTWDGKSIKNVEFCVGDQIVFRQNAKTQPVFASTSKTAFDGLQQAKAAAKAQRSLIGFFKKITQSSPEETPIRHGVFNRTIGTLLSIEKRPNGHATFRILLAEGGEVLIHSDEYQHHKQKALPMTHNFATTIYASQGQTVQRVMMLDSPMMNRKLAYVGASRHTELFDLYVDCEELGQRIRKKVNFERAKAEKKLAYAHSSSKTSLLADADGARLYEQYPDFPAQHSFSEREYLGVVASTWNTPSTNQTVMMARKLPKQKIIRDRHWKSPLAPWFTSISKAEEDTVDDAPAFYPKIHMTVKAEPGQKSLFSVGPAAVIRSSDISLSSEPTAFIGDAEGVVFDSDGVSEDVLRATEHLLWNKNKHGEPRLLAFDHADGSVRARYSLDGTRLVGDGEIPVFKNEQADDRTPVFVVHSFREAVLAWTHYRTRFSETPQHIPHVACVLPGVSLHTLLPHLHEHSKILVSHGKKEGNLEQALHTGSALEALGLPVDYRPKLMQSPVAGVNHIRSLR
jgi:AAA domain